MWIEGWDKKSLASQLSLIVEQDAVVEWALLRWFHQLLQPNSTCGRKGRRNRIPNELPISVPLSFFVACGIMKLLQLQKGFPTLSYKFLLFRPWPYLAGFWYGRRHRLDSVFLEEQGVTEIQTYKDYYIPMNKGFGGIWSREESPSLSLSIRAFLVFCSFWHWEGWCQVSPSLSAAYCSARPDLRRSQRAFGQSNSSWLWDLRSDQWHHSYSDRPYGPFRHCALF